MGEGRLLFVYNVDASPVALLKDLYAGITTGSTDCHLCDLTFGRLIKDRSWRRFIKDLPVDVDFQMRSTFAAAHPACAEERFPAAFFLRGDDPPRRVLSAEELDDAEDLDALRAVVADVVGRLPPSSGGAATR